MASIIKDQILTDIARALDLRILKFLFDIIFCRKNNWSRRPNMPKEEIPRDWARKPPTKIAFKKPKTNAQSRFCTLLVISMRLEPFSVEFEHFFFLRAIKCICGCCGFELKYLWIGPVNFFEKHIKKSAAKFCTR